MQKLNKQQQHERSQGKCILPPYRCTYFIKHIYMFVCFVPSMGLFIHIEVKNNFS